MLENIAEELHAPARKKFTRRKVISLFKDDLWQADLIDMQSHSKQNKGYKFVLIVIDTFTKYVWVEPLKNKTGNEVVKCMSNILKKASPKLLQTDNGTEFYNTYFKNLMSKYKIRHYSVYSNIKAAMVERVIRTVKNRMYKYFTANGSWTWINHIPRLIHNYNNSVHSTIKCTPQEARLNPNIIQLHANILETGKIKKPKFKIGDKVRISKYKHTFSKGYTMNWSTEIFTIGKLFKSRPITYQIKDESNNTILGRFYEEELKKTNYPDTFLVERIVKKNKNKILVKWLGLANHSWININDVLN